MAKIIQVYNRKGGVGKSTSVIQIAGELSKNHGKRVLVIDLDSSSNASNGLAHNADPDIFLSEIMTSYLDGIDEDIHDAICHTAFENLDLMAANSNYMEQAAQTLSANPMFTPFTYLKPFLEQVRDDYDYIIIDSAQGDASIYNMMALGAADYVLTPTDDNLDGTDGISWLQARIAFFRNRNPRREMNINPDLEWLGVFVNRASLQRSLTKEMIKHLAKNYGDKFIDATIRDAAIVGKARVYQTPLCYLDSNAPVTKDFAALTNNILERIENSQYTV